MVVLCKEEVFSWFKELSGAKRIELMCGLLNLCIPLEWRFFATFLEQAAKRDYVSLKEAETKSNSAQEFEKLTSLDWLGVDNRTNEEELTQNGSTQSSQSTSKEGNASISTLINNSYSQSNDNINSLDKHLSSVRSKIVVYLCLLSAANRMCATIAFKAFRTQLRLENISSHLFGSINISNESYSSTSSNTSSPLNSSSSHSSLSLTKAKDSNSHNSRSSSEHSYSHLVLDNNFYSEIILLHTLAIHHPAFTFEQQALLSEQLQKVQQWMDAIMFASAASAVSSNPGSGTFYLLLLFQRNTVVQNYILIFLYPFSFSLSTTSFYLLFHSHSLTYSLSSVASVANSSSFSGVNLGDINQSQLVQMTNKLSLKSNVGDQNCLSGLSSADNGRKLSASSCSNCNCSCSCNNSSINSVATTPSTSPPPSNTSLAASNSVTSQSAPAIHLSSTPSVHPPMHPYWFYFPPPPLPPPPPPSIPGTILNGFATPPQTSEQLFQYYYAVAMAAATTLGSTHFAHPSFWPHFQLPPNTFSSSFSFLPTMANNSLVAAAASFQTAKNFYKSCYNCGAHGHHGSECKQQTFDDQPVRY